MKRLLGSIAAIGLCLGACAHDNKPAQAPNPPPSSPQPVGVATPAADVSRPTPTDTSPGNPGRHSNRRVMILATGGTIAGAGTAGDYAYKSGEFKVEDLIKAVPNLDKLARLSGEQVASIGSQDMNDDVWIKLALRTNQLLATGDVDGIVITHGTDTLEETGYFLNLVVKSDKPVVLVGSMRPATAISADGPANLYNGVAVAVSPGAAGRGVLLALNDKIQQARDATKMNTTNVETFESPNRGPVGLVNSGKIIWFERTDKKHTTQSEFAIDSHTRLPRVDIIYAHSNMDAALIQRAIENGAKGIVIAGVGDGNMSKAAVEALAQAVKNQVMVVRSTRVPTGVVLANNEIKDDELGFVASGELNPPKARVLLQLALLRTREPKQIQRMFNEY